MNYKPKIEFDEECLQDVAESHIGRTLTKKEYEEVCEEVNQELSFLVMDKIDKVIELNKIIKRGNRAKNSFPHYKIFYKNENSFRFLFEFIQTTKTKDDAIDFIHKDFMCEFDYWYVIKLNKDGTEERVYSIEAGKEVIDVKESKRDTSLVSVDF